MTRHFLAALLVTSGALALGCRSASGPPTVSVPEQPQQAVPSFSDIQALARRESQRPEAKHWEQQSVAGMNAPLDVAMNSCHGTDVDGESHSFTALVQLAADGHVRQVLVSPVNPFSACARTALKGLMFPGSPWEGYWLEIEMQPRPGGMHNNELQLTVRPEWRLAAEAGVAGDAASTVASQQHVVCLPPSASRSRGATYSFWNEYQK